MKRTCIESTEIYVFKIVHLSTEGLLNYLSSPANTSFVAYFKRDDGLAALLTSENVAELARLLKEEDTNSEVLINETPPISMKNCYLTYLTRDEIMKFVAAYTSCKLE